MKVFLLTLLLSLNAVAANHHGQIGIGGVLGPVFEAPWSTEPAKKAMGAGARLGAFARFNHDDPNAGFELALDSIELLRSPMGMQVFTLNFFRRYRVFKQFQPIVAVGVGVSNNHDFFGRGNQDTPAFRVRVGVETALQERIDIGLYLDHFSIFKSRSADPDLQILAPALTLIYNFGEVLTAQAPATTTSPTATVSPAPAQVAEVDSDLDGVFDSLDRCPGTAKGISVNELGCAAKQSFEVNLNVKFKNGTATLEAGDMADLKSVADIMNTHSDLRLELDGYTDSRGDSAKNQALSLARAEAVKTALVQEFKVDAARLSAKGFGSASPVASNKTSEGRAKNRRVTAKILR